MALMQVKVMFFVMIPGLYLLVFEDFRMRSPCKFWESIVHLIVVSNSGCQYRTLFLNQIADVNIAAAAAEAAASSNTFRHVMPYEACFHSNFGSQ